MITFVKFGIFIVLAFYVGAFVLNVVFMASMMLIAAVWSGIEKVISLFKSDERDKERIN